jgi:hypothetical protein
MAKTQRYYLNFALQFGNADDIKKVINVTKRLIPRLRGLLSNRLANTKLVEQAKIGVDTFTMVNAIRKSAPRFQDIRNNFSADKQIQRDGSHFFVYHKFMDKDKEYTYTDSNPKGKKKTHKTSAKLILNFLQYGRRGAYHIPKTVPDASNPVVCVWRYGRGYRPIIRPMPPNKRIFVRRKKTWTLGMFDWVNLQIRDYVSDVRDEIASIIKSEGAIPK